MIFYDYFFKASVGDTAWKKSIMECSDPTEPLAPPQSEAFAMLLLKNNYFAWLWEAKNQYKDLLVTEYDTKKKRAQKFEDLGHVYLKCQLNLEVDEDEDDMNKIVILPTRGETIGLYDTLLSHSRRDLQKVWKAAARNKKYKEFTKALGQLSDEDDDSSSEEEQPEQAAEQIATDEPEQEASSLMEQRTKKRKILKSFQEYMNSNEEEGTRFKGWSSRAGEVLSKLTEKLNKVTYKEKAFRRAYRHTYKQKLVTSGKKKKSNPEPKPANYQSKIWCLEEITGEVEV